MFAFVIVIIHMIYDELTTRRRESQPSTFTSINILPPTTTTTTAITLPSTTTTTSTDTPSLTTITDTAGISPSSSGISTSSTDGPSTSTIGGISTIDDEGWDYYFDGCGKLRFKEKDEIMEEEEWNNELVEFYNNHPEFQSANHEIWDADWNSGWSNI